MNLEEIIGNLYIRLLQANSNNKVLVDKIALLEQELEKLAGGIVDRARQEQANK